MTLTAPRADPLEYGCLSDSIVRVIGKPRNRRRLGFAPTTHPDFNTVDTQRHGYLTADDVKNDEYVSKNFDKCNVKHNGHMSRKQYANCHE
jgi:hypothetical protein